MRRGATPVGPPSLTFDSPMVCVQPSKPYRDVWECGRGGGVESVLREYTGMRPMRRGMLGGEGDEPGVWFT